MMTSGLTLLGVCLLVSGLLSFLFLLYWFAYAPYQVLKKCGIQGPTPVPFFGNYKERMNMNPLKYNEYLTEKYGPVSGFYIGQQPYILISDLDMLKRITVTDFENFSDHSPAPNFLADDHSAKELFSATGNTWRMARKCIAPSLSPFKLKMMEPLLKKSVDSLVTIFGEKAERTSSFDIKSLFGHYTVETALATIFGCAVDIQRGERRELSESVDLLISGFADGKIDYITLLCSNLPWMTTLMEYAFTYSSAGKASAHLQKVILGLAKSRREEVQVRKYNDIFQAMLEASDNEVKEVPTECLVHTETMKTRYKFTNKEVVANSLGFLMAGNETVTNTLSFALYLLALNPDIQEKLQSEIDHFFEEKTNATLYEAAQEIAYLDNVVHETLRLYPPNIEIERFCNKTTVVNGFVIPEGATVLIPVYLLQNNPLYWKDPWKFDPDRFTSEEKAKRPPHCYGPFGLGPRICIGMRLGLLQTKIPLIELLKRYTFVTAPDTEEASLYEAAQEIAYLNSVIQESLHLYPPNHETDRYCKKTTVVNRVTIPEGAAIIISIYILHHSLLHWNDPKKFDPDSMEKAATVGIHHTFVEYLCSVNQLYVTNSCIPGGNTLYMININQLSLVDS